MNYESTILSVYNSSEYQQLKEYYGKSTLFSTLGIARSENKHSAFLAWLFDTAADHKLGSEPLKKLLGLYALRSTIISNSMKTQLVTGHYNLTDVCVSTEDTLANYEGGEGMKDNQKRLDIVCSFSIVPVGTEDAPIEVILVVENKIYSKESQPNGRMQTQIYHDCMSDYCNRNKKELFEIFLTPDVAQNPACEAYCKLTYQELLDSVITPLSFKNIDSHTSMMLADYIRNLGVPAFNMDDQDKVMDDYTIMAIPMELKLKLSGLYAEFKDLYNAALTIAGGNKAETILGSMVESTEDALLLQNFWDSNITLFNTILYVCCTDITSDTKQQKLLMDIFKASKRDTTKYIVLWDASGEGTDWKPVKGYDKGLTKGKAAAVFFMEWMEMNCPKTIEEVRQIFPTSINSYYNRKTGSFDSLIWFTADEVTAETESGFKVKIADVGWDLYPIVHNRTHDTSFGLGYGPVYDGYQKKGLAMIAKMWRKDDFENLLDYIQVNQQKYFSRIKIEKM